MAAIIAAQGITTLAAITADTIAVLIATGTIMKPEGMKNAQADTISILAGTTTITTEAAVIK